MAQNIFDATLDPNNDIKVNNFDWSHANNLTTQIGRITPNFCDMVPAKTSFRVNPRFGLQFMPMVFPIQTRMKARIMWFRYPLRALWKDYKDFVGNFREGLEEPYLDINTSERLKKMCSTGSLGDYLGLPTTLVGSYGGTSTPLELSSSHWYSKMGYYIADVSNNRGVLAGTPGIVDASSYMQLRSMLGFTNNNTYVYPASTGATFDTGIPVGKYFQADCTIDDSFVQSDYVQFVLNGEPTDCSDLNQFIFVIAIGPDGKSFDCPFAIRPDGEGHLAVNASLTSEALAALRGKDVTFCLSYKPFLGIESWLQYEGSVNKWSCTFSSFRDKYFTVSPTVGGTSSVQFTVSISSDLECSSASLVRNPDVIHELTLDTSPWYSSVSGMGTKQQKILAYAFRAYEGIYNSFIRDNRNNPYYLNGQVQYNKWIPTDEGGADTTLYELKYANWEKDFLTTAVQSPQQGNAPLVGITTYTQTVQNEDGTRTELIKTSLVDEDGKKYGLSFTQSDEGLEGVEYVELDNGTQVRQARSLYDLATSGISIPDLRMVNCYQKFLELNMRKGYSYKDIVEGRFDVKVRYADLLMPEFFGGVSRDIDVNSITQTVDQNVQGQTSDYDKALGSQAGLAGVRGEANANIECFCDEESIIMGLLIVTPLPVYTQLLPKHFTYRGLMEHYQPEFNLIGFQPIKYNEVCPIQAYNDNPDSLTETFGYNRPWYEFAQKYDVAHGLFRTSLSNFLMHRVFDQKPQLAQSFLTVDPEQVTDVFAVTETTDKIYGQIWLDITCKLPIARVAIPRLD